MDILKTIRNVAITTYAALTLNPTEAAGQNMSDRNIPKYDPKTFLDERGNHVYSVDQYVDDDHWKGPHALQKEFMRGVQEDGVVDKDMYKKLGRKDGSKTVDAIVFDDVNQKVHVHLSDGAGIEDVTKSWTRLHASTTQGHKTFRNNGSAALDSGDDLLSSTTRIVMPARTAVRDGTAGAIEQSDITIVNVIHEDVENDPGNFYLYRAILDSDGNQITTNDQGHQLQEVGALKFIPANKKAEDAVRELIKTNSYPGGIIDFRQDFLNGFILDIYHSHYKNGGGPAEIVNFDVLGSLEEIGIVLQGDAFVDVVGEVKPTGIINGAELFGANKDDVIPARFTDVSAPSASLQKPKTGF